MKGIRQLRQRGPDTGAEAAAKGSWHDGSSDYDGVLAVVAMTGS
jgi:hypothetical protein